MTSGLHLLAEAGELLARDRLLAAIERRLTRALRAAWLAQGVAFLQRLGLAWPVSGAAAWEILFDGAADETAPRFADPLDREALAALVAGWSALANELGVKAAFTRTNPAVTEYLRDYGAAKVRGLTDTTRGQLRTLLVQAAEEQWAYSRTAREIRTRFDGFAGKAPQKHLRSRAEVVAVQEIGDAYEHARQAVARQLTSEGTAVEKSWLTSGAPNVDAPCRDNAQAGWIPLDQPFPAGAERAPQHITCRCTTLYRVA